MKTKGKKLSQKNKWSLIILVLCGLLGIFWLVISAVPVADDEQLFASAAQSYITTGQFTAWQMFGNDRVRGVYSMIAPLHVWMGSLAYRLAQVLQTGGLQVFYLLNPIYTAACGALLVFFCRLRGYSNRTALISAAAFGLTTIAFPYTKTYFREPLAMLLVLMAYLAGELALKANSGKVQTLWLISGLVLFGCAVWTKEFVIAMLPFFLLVLWKNRKALLMINTGKKRKHLIAGSLVVILFVIGILIILIGRDTAGRFSISYLRRLWGYLPILQHDFLLEAIAGALFSPGKGLFLYSPILLIGLITPFFKFNQKNWDDWLLAAGTTLGLVFLQAYFYDFEWWTFVWGTRFLLPVIPLWILVLASVFEKCLTQNYSKLRLVVFFFILLGFFIQMGRILISDADFIAYLYVTKGIHPDHQLAWRWDVMPAIAHWQMVFRHQPLDLPWLRIWFVNPWSCVLGIGALLILTFFAIRGWHSLWKLKRISRSIVVSCVLLVMILPVVILSTIRHDPLYTSNRGDFAKAIRFLDTNVRENQLVVLDAYNEPLWYFYFNYAFNPSQWISLPTVKYSIGGKTIFYPRMEESLDNIKTISKGKDAIWLIEEVKGEQGIISFAEEMSQENFKEVQRDTIDNINIYKFTIK
jgi:hypothetical protein